MTKLEFYYHIRNARNCYFYVFQCLQYDCVYMQPHAMKYPYRQFDGFSSFIFKLRITSMGSVQLEQLWLKVNFLIWFICSIVLCLHVVICLLLSLMFICTLCE